MNPCVSPGTPTLDVVTQNAMRPKQTRTTGESSLQLYRRALGEVHESYAWLAVLLLVGLLRMPLTLLVPVPLKIVVDNVIAGHPLPWALASNPIFGNRQPGSLLFVAVTVFVILTFISFLHVAAEWSLRQWVGQTITNRFRLRLLRHISSLSLTRLETHWIGQAVYAIEQNSSALQSVIAENLVLLATSFVTIVGMLVVLALLSLKICLVVAAVSPLLIAVTYFFGRQLLQRWESVHNSDRAALSLAREVLGALRVVKLFGNEDAETTRFFSFANESLAKLGETLASEGILKLLVGIILAVSSGVVLLISARDVLADRMTVGDLTMVMAYASMLYGPLHLFSTRMLEQQDGLARLREALFILDEPVEIIEVMNPVPVNRAGETISFREVTFHFRPSQPLLAGVSFEIRAGARVGIFGPSGTGKTTLISLLLRFHDPIVGSILIDGQDLRRYRILDLRAQFSVAPQDAVLFERSIAENIAYDRTVDRADIVRAAELAGAHEFIRSLPLGYDTIIAEGGLQLSGGERQRIALARMFLRDAPILILDEPTSALDDEAAVAFYEALDRYAHNRTVFLITHDLNALQRCDILLELNAGHVQVCERRQGCHFVVSGLSRSTRSGTR